jgi:hypothetical protein
MSPVCLQRNGSLSAPTFLASLKKITRSPRRFHVNVKTDKFPVDGAIRGQLKAI